jgi:hypothetical protein
VAMHFKAGKLHSPDEHTPAISAPGFGMAFYDQGKLHRDNNLPAVLLNAPDGTTRELFYKFGKEQEEKQERAPDGDKDKDDGGCVALNILRLLDSMSHLSFSDTGPTDALFNRLHELHMSCSGHHVLDEFQGWRCRQGKGRGILTTMNENRNRPVSVHLSRRAQEKTRKENTLSIR